MNCYLCKRRGKPDGMWWSPKKRNAFVFFVCRNPACVFEYTSFDGKSARGRPRWMFPMRRIK